MACEEAAQRGSLSVGTQHVLLALLASPDDHTRTALRAGGVDASLAVAALRSIVGIGNDPEPTSPTSVSSSPRVARILERAIDLGDRATGQPVQDDDVLRALLTSDDPAVGQLIVHITSSPELVLDALDQPRSA